MVPCQCKVVSFEPQSGAHGVWLKKGRKISRSSFSVSHCWTELLHVLYGQQNPRVLCPDSVFVFSFTVSWTLKGKSDVKCWSTCVVALEWKLKNTFGRKKNSATIGTRLNFGQYDPQKAKKPSFGLSSTRIIKAAWWLKINSAKHLLWAKNAAVFLWYIALLLLWFLESGAG